MMDQKEPTKREQAKRAKRQLIVRCAMTCFIENGIAQTGIRDIADRAQISLGNLYNHFASKDELIAEIAQIEAADLTRLIADVTAGLAFEDFIPHYLEQVATPEHAVLSIEILAAALRQPALATPFDANRKALINALSAHTKANPAEIEMILDAVEALGIRCGLAQRKPKHAEIECLRKMTAALA